MGAEQAKPKHKLDEIDREVTLIRSNVRASHKSLSEENRSNIQENLVKFADEVSRMKGKVKNKQLSSIQKNISETMTEVITMEQELDKAAVETDSFVGVPQNRRSLSLERTRNITKTKPQSKSMPSLINSPTLQDIDNRLKTLRSQIKVALDSEDTTQLRVHKETLKVLATSLEMIDVPEYTPIDDKKKKLDAVVARQYQKVVKALKEIRMNKNIQYLNNQMKIEDNMKELEVIKKEIDQCDSLSRKALKDGDSVAIQDSQEKVKNLKQRLSAFECVDAHSKALKLQMEDQVTWLNKYITEYFQKGSQPDLTKAQTCYEDIIKSIASGTKQNDLAGRLESLQSFTNCINTPDEDNDKRKKQLLGNINDSLITLGWSKAESSTNSVDIGVLERNATYDDYKLKSFMNAWKVLENVLQKPTISKETYCHVDEVLNDVKNSIIATRQTLKLVYNPQSKLSNKFSSSVPNLVENNRTNSSNEAAEVVNSSEKKTDPSNATSLLASNGQVHLRNKPNTRKDERRFSKINEIKTQINYIKEKFEASIQKPNLKTKLEAYSKTLEEYSKTENQVIANNAKSLLADVQQIVKNIDRAMAPQYQKLPVEYYSDILRSREENVLRIEKSAKSTATNDGGYLETKNLLNDIKENLQTIDIPPEYESVNYHRLQILQKIEEIIVECEKDFSVREETYVREVQKKMENLKDRVNRFSSPYKGVLYNAIEKDLTKILVEADGNITNKLISGQIITDTEKYLKILENRATKDQDFGQSKQKQDSDKMSAIKEELQTIKNDIDLSPMNSTDTFIALNSRLDLIKLTIDQLKNFDENIEQQKEIIYNEIETLKNVVMAKIALGQQDINQTSLEEFKRKTTEENNKRVSEELDKIELTFEKLKNDIMNFVGTRSDKKFYELDESIMRLNMKIDDLKLAKEAPYFARKEKLLKAIHQCEILLDKRTKETDYLTQFERDVTDIENNFSRYTQSMKGLENLTERVKFLKENLRASEFSNLLSERKTMCLEKIEHLELEIANQTQENFGIQQNLVKMNSKLQVIKNSFVSVESSIDLVRESIKSENMSDLNIINQERTERLNELIAVEENLLSKQTSAQNPITVRAAEDVMHNDNIIDLEMSEIEKKMGELKNEVQTYIGTARDERFCELDNAINNVFLQLGNIILNKDNPYYQKKLELINELNSLSEVLDKRAEDSENMFAFEQEFKKIQENKSAIPEDYLMQKIQTLENLEVQEDSIDWKSECLSKYKALLKNTKSLNDLVEISNIERQFKEIDDAVNNFLGTTSDSTYVDIDNKLCTLITAVEKISSEDAKLNELTKQIEDTRSFLRNKAKENKIYADFMKELNLIGTQINNTTDRNAIVKVHNKVKFIQADVEKAPLKEMVKNQLHQKCTVLLQLYSEKMNSLPKTNYIGSTDFLKDLEISPVISSKPPLASFEKQFEILSTEISQVESKVDEFVGDEKSPDFRTLEDGLLKLNVRVKKLNDFGQNENTKKKLHLKEKVVNCLTKIDQSVQDFEIVIESEREFDNINNSLQRDLSQKDLDSNDEKLIALQLRLGKLKLSSKPLLERKNKLMKQIMNLTQVIKNKTSNGNSEDSGTSI